jgi:hypothetical protein
MKLCLLCDFFTPSAAAEMELSKAARATCREGGRIKFIDTTPVPIYESMDPMGYASFLMATSSGAQETSKQPPRLPIKSFLLVNDSWFVCCWRCGGFCPLLYGCSSLCVSAGRFGRYFILLV